MVIGALVGVAVRWETALHYAHRRAQRTGRRHHVRMEPKRYRKTSAWWIIEGEPLHLEADQ